MSTYHIPSKFEEWIPLKIMGLDKEASSIKLQGLLVSKLMLLICVGV